LLTKSIDELFLSIFESKFNEDWLVQEVQMMALQFDGSMS